MSSTVTRARSLPVLAPPAAPGRPKPLFALPAVRWATGALALFLAALAAQLLDGSSWLSWLLYLACYVAGGWEPALSAMKALRNRTLDVDLLMVAAAIGAASIGEVREGALLIVIFATSGALEAVATARTEESVRGLMKLAPETTRRITPDGHEETVSVAELEVGDVVLVRPGERIGAEGEVIDGASEVDQATVTGEPMPVDKAVGDRVFAGTLNGTGSLQVRVERRAEDSVVARIAALVERASKTKAKTQLFIEKVEQRYSIGMVAATIGVFVIPLLLGDAVRDALLRAMTFMIVASPCAVVLATMPPLLAAIANAGRHGVLVKSAVVMEQLGATTRVAFDKTGTLTRGKPELVEIRLLPGACIGEDEILRLAAGAERRSEHPLAAAIVRAAQHRGLDVPSVEEFVAYPGRGICAMVTGRSIHVGSPRALLSQLGETAEVHAARAVVTGLESRGRTALVVLCEHRPVAVLGVTDQLRVEAGQAVAAVARLTGRAPTLLTGDNSATAAEIAGRVGITDVRAHLFPEDKVAVVREMAASGERVTLVGDGLNDAPALAVAHAGIAIGRASSDLTLQTADAVVIHDDLTAIPTVIALSRRARRVVTANLVIAATFISVLVVWDLIGHLPLPVGVAGHEGSTVIVGLNGLRMLRRAAWRRAAQSGPEATSGLSTTLR